MTTAQLPINSGPRVIPSGATITRMWKEGPLRCQRSDADFSGSYVCDGCQVPTVGVYRVKQWCHGQIQWLCAACRGAR